MIQEWLAPYTCPLCLWVVTSATSNWKRRPRPSDVVWLSFACNTCGQCGFSCEMFAPVYFPAHVTTDKSCMFSLLEKCLGVQVLINVLLMNATQLNSNSCLCKLFPMHFDLFLCRDCCNWQPSETRKLAEVQQQAFYFFTSLLKQPFAYVQINIHSGNWSHWTKHSA